MVVSNHIQCQVACVIQFTTQCQSLIHSSSKELECIRHGDPHRDLVMALRLNLLLFRITPCLSWPLAKLFSYLGGEWKVELSSNNSFIDVIHPKIMQINQTKWCTLICAIRLPLYPFKLPWVTTNLQQHVYPPIQKPQ